MGTVTQGKNHSSAKNDYPVIHRGWAASEVVMDDWASEKDCPYTEIKPFTWWRSYQLGGRSILWGRQSYRLSDLDFEANLKEGIGVDWPIRYKDIASWYDHVERFAGISGSKEGLQHLPDGQFLPPMELNCVEKDVAARIKKHSTVTGILLLAVWPTLPRPLKEEHSVSSGTDAGRDVLLVAISVHSHLPYLLP